MSLAVLAPPAAGTAAPESEAPRPRAVSLGELTRETQQQYQDAQTLEIVWWLPIDLWAGLLQSAPDAAPSAPAAEQFGDYLIFFVAEAELIPLGGLSFRDAAQTRARFRLQLPGGERRAPLEEDALPGDLQILLRSLLPALASSAGVVGAHFRPFVFEATTDGGARIAAPREPGELSVWLGEREYRWRLPLGALLPPRYCPVDGEQLNGAYRYCPYHGDALTTQEPEGD